MRLTKGQIMGEEKTNTDGDTKDVEKVKEMSMGMKIKGLEKLKEEERQRRCMEEGKRRTDATVIIYRPTLKHCKQKKMLLFFCIVLHRQTVFLRKKTPTLAIIQGLVPKH